MDDLDAITNEDDFQDANNDIPPDDVNNIGNVINPIVNVPNIINPYRAPPIVNSPADKSKEVNDQNILKIRPVIPKDRTIPFGTEGHRFRFPTNAHTIIVGPTQAGKTSFVKKLFIDGFDHPLGTVPYDKIIYVGVEGETNDFAIGAQTMNWTYSKTEPGTSKSIPVFWLPKNEIDKLPSLIKSEENKSLKKLVIVDDSLKGSGSEKIAKLLFALLGEGQHDNAWYIIIGHAAAGFKELKNQCNVRILFKNVDSTDYTTMFGKKSPPFYANLINHLRSFKDDENSLTKHFVIYAVLEDTFYDYNLNKITI